MLVRLTSNTSGEMIMFAEHAHALFEWMGKESTARGVFTREQLPEAIARACQMIVQALRHTHNAQCAELVLPSRVASPQANSQTHARELVRIRQAFSESHWSHRSCNTPLPT